MGSDLRKFEKKSIKGLEDSLKRCEEIRGGRTIECEVAWELIRRLRKKKPSK